MAEEVVEPRIIGIEEIDLARFKKRERETMPSLTAKKRTKDFGEVELGFTELEALFEADRCLQCGLFPNKAR